MQVSKNNEGKVKEIEFCCFNMAKCFLQDNIIKIDPYSSKVTIAYKEIIYCPFCSTYIIKPIL